MVEKYNIRTDLALEEKERFESDQVEVQGVILTEEYDRENEIRITTVRIETENGAKVMGKPVGCYITIEAILSCDINLNLSLTATLPIRHTSFSNCLNIS